MFWTFCLAMGAPECVNHAAAAVGDKIYSFGGYCGEVHMPTHIDIYSFNARTLKWLKVHYEETWNSPLSCYGHSVVAYQDLIYLWGGQTVGAGTNVLYCFNTNNFLWSTPKTFGEIPKPTDGHSACVIGEHMFVYGGFEEANAQYSDEVYALNLVTFRWYKVETSGIDPGKRDFHTASVIGNCMYIFGGRIEENDTEIYPQEIMCLDTDTLIWTIPNCRGSVPSGRRSHSAVVRNNAIYIIGGFAGVTQEHLNDVHRFDPETFTWTEIKVKGEKPTPRRRHCSVLVGDIIYLFGGSRPEDIADGRQIMREQCDMHMLEFVPTLKRLSVLKCIECKLDYTVLPSTLQSEIRWVENLKFQPLFIYPGDRK